MKKEGRGRVRGFRVVVAAGFATVRRDAKKTRDAGAKHTHTLSERHAAYLLRESGFRATCGRIELLSHLAASPHPVSAAELARTLKKQLDEVNVYRALKAFTARGLARMVQYERERARFEFAEGGHHHHLVCTDCGVVEHIDIPSDARLEKEALRVSTSFSAVSAHSLEFSGVCDSCSA